MDIFTLALAKKHADSYSNETEQLTDILSETTVSTDTERSVTGAYYNKVDDTDANFLVFLSIQMDAKYVVIYDGVRYECVPVEWRDGWMLGNAALYTATATDTGEPFGIGFDGAMSYYCATTSGEHTFYIGQSAGTARTIDQKYIPAMDSLTLNGADGNQHKLTVDESGALTVTAV